MGSGVIVALFALGLALVLVEIFVPGGIIGTVGLLMIVVAIVVSFSEGHHWLGSGLVAISLTVIPYTIVKALRRISLRGGQTREDGYTASREGIEELLGRQGVALSALRPAGTARIDDRRRSVVTRGEMIDAHTKIRVVQIDGNRVVVEAVKTG